LKVPSQIIRKAKRKKSSRPTWSKEQETRYKELFAQLETMGFVVRREELKRGHCWKVLSGSCRSLTQNLVFLDSRLSPDDQIAFLQAKIADASPEPNLAAGGVAEAA
jgi:hypothetical protein